VRLGDGLKGFLLEELLAVDEERCPE
jgi:hypothetical protein